MVTHRHEEQKISMDAGSIPATLPKVDSVLIPLARGYGKMSSRTRWAPCMAAKELNSTPVIITCNHPFMWRVSFN